MHQGIGALAAVLCWCDFAMVRARESSLGRDRQRHSLVRSPSIAETGSIPSQRRPSPMHETLITSSTSIRQCLQRRSPVRARWAPGGYLPLSELMK